MSDFIEPRRKPLTVEDARQLRQMFPGIDPGEWTVYRFPTSDRTIGEAFDQIVAGLHRLGYAYYGRQHYLGWYRYRHPAGMLAAVTDRGPIDVAHHRSDDNELHTGAEADEDGAAGTGGQRGRGEADPRGAGGVRRR